MKLESFLLGEVEMFKTKIAMDLAEHYLGKSKGDKGKDYQRKIEELRRKYKNRPIDLEIE